MSYSKEKEEFIEEWNIEKIDRYINKKGVGTGQRNEKKLYKVSRHLVI